MSAYKNIAQDEELLVFLQILKLSCAVKGRYPRPQPFSVVAQEFSMHTILKSIQLYLSHERNSIGGSFCQTCMLVPWQQRFSAFPRNLPAIIF
jgi:hypothetical protein